MDFAAIFKSAGVPYVEYGAWRTRVRPGTFAPEGVILHHTASTGFAATLNVVTNGRPDLNGPLCNIYVARGKCYIISGGRANHAGQGAQEVLNDVRKNIPPSGTARSRGLQDGPGGNGLFVGFEVLSPGTGAVLPEEDWAVAAAGSAAILRYLKHTTGKTHGHGRVIGHAEWTRRKIDPQFGRGADAHINMVRLRQKVQSFL